MKASLRNLSIKSFKEAILALEDVQFLDSCGHYDAAIVKAVDNIASFRAAFYDTTDIT